MHRSYLNVSIIPLFGGVTQSSKQTTPKTSRSLGENLTNKSLIFLFPTQTVTLSWPQSSVVKIEREREKKFFTPKP